MKYNCVNCGAPIDYEQEKCPYCGTYYYDLTTMTIGEAAALKIKVPGKGKFFGKAILRDVEMCMDSDNVIATTGMGDKTSSFRHSMSVSMEMKFSFVVGDNGELLTVIKD